MTITNLGQPPSLRARHEPVGVHGRRCPAHLDGTWLGASGGAARIIRVLGPVQDTPEKRARRCLLGRTNQAGCSLPTQRSLLSGGVSQREEWVEGAELRLAVWLTRGYGLKSDGHSPHEAIN